MTESQKPKTVTFRNLTAGSTVIDEQGRKISFPGPMGGHGTYVTAKSNEIAFLRGMVECTRGMIWEEKEEQADIAVENSQLVADTAEVVGDIVRRADVSEALAAGPVAGQGNAAASSRAQELADRLAASAGKGSTNVVASIAGR